MTEEKKSTFGLDKKSACVLTYVLGWVSGLVFVLAEKEDQEIRFHAWQSIAVFGAINVLSIVLTVVPFVGWILRPFVGLTALILWIILMVKTYQGEKVVLPIAGEWAGKQTKK